MCAPCEQYCIIDEYTPVVGDLETHKNSWYIPLLLSCVWVFFFLEDMANCSGNKKVSWRICDIPFCKATQYLWPLPCCKGQLGYCVVAKTCQLCSWQILRSIHCMNKESTIDQIPKKFIKNMLEMYCRPISLFNWTYMYRWQVNNTTAAMLYLLLMSCAWAFNVQGCSLSLTIIDASSNSSFLIYLQ